MLRHISWCVGNLRQKDKNKIKGLLIDAMAFLKVEAYAGISDAVEKIGDIIDEASFEAGKSYGDPDYEEDDEYEDEEDHDSSF